MPPRMMQIAFKSLSLICVLVGFIGLCSTADDRTPIVYLVPMLRYYTPRGSDPSMRSLRSAVVWFARNMDNSDETDTNIWLNNVRQRFESGEWENLHRADMLADEEVRRMVRKLMNLSDPNAPCSKDAITLILNSHNIIPYNMNFPIGNPIIREARFNTNQKAFHNYMGRNLRAQTAKCIDSIRREFDMFYHEFGWDISAIDAIMRESKSYRFGRILRRSDDKLLYESAWKNEIFPFEDTLKAGRKFGEIQDSETGVEYYDKFLELHCPYIAVNSLTSIGVYVLGISFGLINVDGNQFEDLRFNKVLNYVRLCQNFINIISIRNSPYSISNERFLSRPTLHNI